METSQVCLGLFRGAGRAQKENLCGFLPPCCCARSARTLSVTLVQTQRGWNPIIQHRRLRRLKPALFHLPSEAQTKQTTKQPPGFVRAELLPGFASEIVQPNRRRRGRTRARRMMYGRGVHGAAALAGADWQGEPTPRCDGSLFPISQATALSRDGDPAMFSSRESLGSLGTSTMNGAFFSQVLGASSKHLISSPSAEMFTPHKTIICLFF